MHIFSFQVRVGLEVTNMYITYIFDSIRKHQAPAVQFEISCSDKQLFFHLSTETDSLSEMLYSVQNTKAADRVLLRK
jgi:hypothetical protein